MKIFTAALLFCAVLSAEEPPVIPAEVRAEFYRANGAASALKPAWDEVSADLTKAIAALQSACGEKFTPSIDGKRLICAQAQKPEPPKEKK